MLKKKPANTREYVRYIHELYIYKFDKAPPTRHMIINSIQYYLAKTKQWNALEKFMMKLTNNNNQQNIVFNFGKEEIEYIKSKNNIVV